LHKSKRVLLQSAKTGSFYPSAGAAFLLQAGKRSACQQEPALGLAMRIKRALIAHYLHIKRTLNAHKKSP
jgi:hypothetical protein